MAKKTTTTLSREDLIKAITEKREALAKMAASVSGSKPAERTTLRREVARHLTALTALDKSSKNV
jgi:ribosomal protein L29